MSVDFDIKLNPDTKKFEAVYDGIVFKSVRRDWVVEKILKHKDSLRASGDLPEELDEKGEPVPPKANPLDAFSINERFEFVEAAARMAANGTQNCVIISGEGGLGKTHTVLQTLKKLGMRNVSISEDLALGEVMNTKQTYQVVKGFSSAPGLYDILYGNRHGLSVFDDIDSIFRDDDAINLLKAAYDTYSDRSLSWGSRGTSSDVPKSFKYEGRAIFITNLRPHKIDQAIRSRAIIIDLSMTTEQKLERMETIMYSRDFLPEISRQIKMEAMQLIKEVGADAKELSLRTLVAVSNIRAGGGENWKQFARYSLVI